MSNASPRKPRAGNGRTIRRRFCGSASRRFTGSRMPGLFPIIPNGRLSSTKAQFACPCLLTRPPCSKTSSRPTGWGSSWRDGIYDYVHYHSRIHEVLGIARGSGRVQFGGPKGRTLVLKAGDVALLPAGTGHQCLKASGDFLVVGAYPPSGTYDECTSHEDRKKALSVIPRVARPRKDPVYGAKGPLMDAWHKRNRPRAKKPRGAAARDSAR